jgi:hypothetical protein
VCIHTKTYNPNDKRKYKEAQEFLLLSDDVKNSALTVLMNSALTVLMNIH